ncbi:AprI/Inh family metalloprotease inhibitor [Mesorhizobium sp. KR1-2]|uniref:AprI/Inh family metalloprotease inhibitor n=1 Tax=Mesorhizobium sp. KR1-2 TaxID=3156609 RepID=UPI0032B537D4
MASGEQSQGDFLLNIGIRCAVAATLSFALWTTAALAQSEADLVAAFSGKWKVFDARFGKGDERCVLDLGKTSVEQNFSLGSAGCGGELAGAAKWGIVDKQLALLGDGNLVLARLGGNQRRITGTTAGGLPVILDRVDGTVDRLDTAVKTSGCYFLGFTNKCAPKEELGDPLGADSAGSKKINVIVNLNVRAEARDDAGIVGAVPQGACIEVDTCLTASDGVWCQAQFGPKTGWLRKTALRKERWPIITFVNKCDAKQ